MDSYTYYQNRIYGDEERAILSLNRAFLFGESVFTTFRTYDGKICSLDDYLERLYLGIEYLLLNEASVSKRSKSILFDEIVDGVKQLIARSDQDLILRVTAFLNQNRREMIASDDQVQFVVSSSLLPDRVIESLSLLPHPLLSRSWPSYLKIGEIAGKVIDLKKARREGFDDLLYHRSGKVLETTKSNLFFIDSKQRIITPSLQDGILAGITRKNLQKFCINVGISFVEKEIDISQLPTMQQAFASNSIFNILPIDRIGDIQFEEDHFLKKLAVDFYNYQLGNLISLEEYGSYSK